jgi:hypothetical protein
VLGPVYMRLGRYDDAVKATSQRASAARIQRAARSRSWRSLDRCRHRHCDGRGTGGV